MTPEAVRQLQARLTDDRDRTVVRIAALERDLARITAEVEVDPPDDEHDPDGATVGFERAQAAAWLADAHARLADVAAAIRRVEDGHAGRCTNCAGPIGPDRLEARPAARTCIGCARTATVDDCVTRRGR